MGRNTVQIEDSWKVRQYGYLVDRLGYSTVRRGGQLG
jgi:hypothetical protein